MDLSDKRCSSRREEHLLHVKVECMSGVAAAICMAEMGG